MRVVYILPMKLSRLRKLSWKLFLVYALVVILIAAADPSDEKWMNWTFGVGTGLILVCIWIRMWAAGHLVKNKVLTVTGPYAYVKNPLYIGTFLGMTGFALCASGDPKQIWYFQYLNWMIFGLGILVFVFSYVPYKKKREGDRLHDIFGDDWDHFDKAVPDYFPKLTRYEKAENRPWSWKASCDNSEQWTPLAVVAGLVAVVYNQWILDQVQQFI